MCFLGVVKNAERVEIDSIKYKKESRKEKERK